MIHTKSLIRRLDFVPWLLAACLLVWAGSAQALTVGQGGRLAVNPDSDAGVSVATTPEDAVQYDEIMLSLDLTEVNENALMKGGSHADKAAVEIKVTATRLHTSGDNAGKPMNDDQAKAAKATRTRISLGHNVEDGEETDDSNPTTIDRPEGTTTDLTRYIISMPVLIIEAAKAKGEATVTFVPLNDTDDATGTRGTDADDDDLRIWITGEDNDGADPDITTVRPEYFMLRDADRPNRAITFSLDKTSVSKESDKIDVTVTASLDAKPTATALTFSFKDVTGVPAPAGTPSVDDEGFEALGSADKIVRRDAFYDGTGFGNIVIAKDKMTATKTFSIDPINVNDALLSTKDNWIALGSEDGPLRGEQLQGAGTDGTDDDVFAMIEIVPAFIKLTKEGAA